MSHPLPSALWIATFTLFVALAGIPFWTGHAMATSSNVAPLPNAASPELVEKVLAGELEEANAAWWGFDQEDATDPLQAALNSGVSRLYIPNMGTDWVVRPLTLQSNMEIVFEEGVVVAAKRGEYLGTNDSVMTGRDVENLTLRGYGATIRMHKPDYTQPPYKPAEWRHGLSIRGGKNVRILGVTIRDTGGDGIYLGRGSRRITNEDVVIRDVIADNNHRQGISVITARNLVIESSVLKNTMGTAPMAGLDIEPNRADEPVENITVRNNEFIDNDYAGVLIVLSNLTDESDPVSIFVENNVMTGNVYGIRLATATDAAGPTGFMRFQHNVIENSPRPGIEIYHKTAKDNLRLVFANNVLHNVATLSNMTPIAVQAKNAPIHSIEWMNTVVVDTKYRPFLIAEDQGFERFTGDIRVINPHGADINWQAPTDNVTLEVVPSTDAFIYFSYPPKTVTMPRAIHIPQLGNIHHPARVQGIIPIDIMLPGFDLADVATVAIQLDGEVIYEGSDVPPISSVTFDTRRPNADKLPSFRHELLVEVKTKDGDVARQTADFTSRNYVHIKDPLDGPTPSGWFGTLYYPMTLKQSEGWYYVTDNPDQFGGDDSRKTREANTTEYLVWETPNLEDARFTLYAPAAVNTATLRDVLHIATSADGDAWVTLPYDIAAKYAESDEVQQLVVSAQIDPAREPIRLTRLTLKQTEVHQPVQLGDALFIGRAE